MTTIDKIYNLRNKFSVIALTGVTGSGCTELAKLMSGNEHDFFNQLRTLNALDVLENSKSSEIFKRKYIRAYSLLKKKHESYKLISYKNVVILETLVLLLWKRTKEESVALDFANILIKQFRPSVEEDKYQYQPLSLTEQQLESWGFQKVVDELQQNIHCLSDWDNKKNEWRIFISKLFFSDSFKKFCDELFEYLKRADYYLKNFLIHRLGNSIRSFGDPNKTLNKDTVHEVNMDKLFLIIGVINDIIKGYSHEGQRNFVVDSLRCSLEIVYLRERYNAFYMVSMHNDKCLQTIVEKVKKYHPANAQIQAEHIFNLGLHEIKPDAYEDGIFAAPDIYNCIGNSEIHIFKRDYEEIPENCIEFYTTAEQWMKVLSLLLHPGLFTPTSDERCMSMAFQVKFNSGCISRQVGCVITDENYTIKSVGWNDVPVGQIPCGLTHVQEFFDLNDDADYSIYSKFEQEGKVNAKYKVYDEHENLEKEVYENKPFKECMKNHYTLQQINKIKEQGLLVPFCFKSCYNKFQGQKDNVNTRSLHAEENTMLQICKNGGVGLNGGKMYVTASPCVLCSKKAYQIGIREIIYLDKYTDIAADQILDAGFDKPVLRGFCGIIGSTYFKLYQPFMSFKDELEIRFKD